MSERFDVIVVGTGFGGSVAACRLAEAGFRVAVLERGGFVSQDSPLFWRPERGQLGRHDIRARGDVIPWLGAGLGGGSHVYGGALARRDTFKDIHPDIGRDEMEHHYTEAERMLGATDTHDPDPAPADGHFKLGYSFAGDDGNPYEQGEYFDNRHGVVQKTWDPQAQALLGGDLWTKNTLDRNYLAVAIARGASVFTHRQADLVWKGIDGFHVVARHPIERGKDTHYVARALVLSAGALGSTVLLLRNNIYGISPALGTRYSTNGDYLSLALPHWGRALAAWAGVAAAGTGLLAGDNQFAYLGLALYYASALWGNRVQPDKGTLIQGAYWRLGDTYAEVARYPTPGRTLLWSLFRRFKRIERPYAVARLVGDLADLVPPLGAIAKSWPVPLVTMGRDPALGKIFIDARGQARVEIDLKQNAGYYRDARKLGRHTARLMGALWLPNIPKFLLGKQEITHNLGGCPMGTDWTHSVVDSHGRAHKVPGLSVLDGSILPCAIGPNPSLTITALAERGVKRLVSDLKEGRY